MRMSALFGAKTSDFLQFTVCPHGQGGREMEPVRSFANKGVGGHFSAILCGRLFRHT